MADQVILHHYENSPYAEKIRLMFGLSKSSWASLLSPAWPPRPNVDPLSGGYRRIPIAQIGADIFCDSTLIAREVANLNKQPLLDPTTINGEARALMNFAEEQGFFSAIIAVPPTKLLATMIKNFGPIGAFRFAKDRSGILKGGSTRAPSSDDAREVMQKLFSMLNEHLATQAWVYGEQPSIADFTVYHPIWLYLNCSGKIPAEATRVLTWFEKIAAIGQGDRTEIGQADAFAAARDSEPRALPVSTEATDHELGSTVAVAPEDYGVVPVTGHLAAVTENRIVLARESTQFGLVHVHFPRAGYSIAAA
ncbi:MAG: glutathione S-transferase family protein [Pseudomonadota bacterium]